MDETAAGATPKAALTSVMALFASAGPGGLVVRRLLPAAVGALVVIVFLRLEGPQLGLYGTEVEILLLTLAAGGAIAGLLFYFAFRLDRDEAARGEAEGALRRSSRYFDLSSDMVCTAGFDGVFKELNTAWTETLGWSEAELCSRPFVEFVHPDDRETTEREATGLAAGGVTVNFMNRYATKDGRWRWIEWKAIAILEEGLIYASARDITGRKAAEAALEASERQTRQILETAHDAFVSIDADGLITAWNPQAEANFGWSSHEALGRELAATIIPEAHREAHRRGMEHFLATGEGPVLGKRLELTALHRDGREFPIELTMSDLETEQGFSFNAFIRDITERRASRELLERQRQQLIEAQSVGGFGSWEWDLVTGTIERSDELCRIYGLEPGSHPGSVEAMAPAHPDDRARWQSDVQATLESGAPLSIEFRIVMPDGSVRVMHSRGELVHDEHGTPLRVIGTTQDITERHELERAKDEFTSIVSHELRTPLTSIRGSLGLLESGVLGELPAQGQRMVEIAVQNTDRLVRLIDDILDIERINSGQIDMNPGPCDARELIARASDAVAALAAAANVSVLIDAEPVHFSADGDRVIQTLTNLISNAVKFSPPASSVRVSCSRRDGEVLFEVSDEGRGIPAENVETVFGRFQQVDASDSREKGGTGLGLAICRSIVDQHGGRIWAHSVPGHGATFSFLLPAPVGDVADRGPST